MSTRPVVEDDVVASAAVHVMRPATVADLPTCARIWRESINDYTAPLNLPEVPDDLAAILRLYAHLLSTDPTRFVVAERNRDGGKPVIDAFVVAVVRDELWFLS
ncbi:MAG TPA: hypothetical protein VIM24_06165, partial [Candidatus Limnocylindrales bacterium]